LVSVFGYSFISSFDMQDMAEETGSCYAEHALDISMLCVAALFSINTKVIFEDITAVMFCKVVIQLTHIHVAISQLIFATFK